jgi:hypothetical protein
MAATAEDRRIKAQIAAHTSWARTPDRQARTAPATAALMARFEREVDPEGVLPAHERAVRAEHARKAYFARLALRSATSRRKAREARVRAAELEATADAADAERAAGESA